MVRCGIVTPDDGVGYVAKLDNLTQQYFEDLDSDVWPPPQDFEYIAWYNK